MTKNEGKIEEREDWLNEHGQPDFEYLQSLVVDGSPEALERLKTVAEDLDVEYDAETSPEELIGRIRSAVDQNENDESDVISVAFCVGGAISFCGSFSL
jgi:hypothetical protein